MIKATNTSLLPDSPSFFEVYEPPLENYQEISLKIEAWLVIAKGKEELAEELHPQIFRASAFILSEIKNHIEESLKLGKIPNKSLFVCRDVHATIQGVSIFSKQECFLNCIASNPENLPHLINTQRVHGIGTAMIRHFAQIAKEKNQSIFLFSIPIAETFYIKLGFEHIYPFQMELTISKINQLLSRIRPL